MPSVIFDAFINIVIYIVNNPSVDLKILFILAYVYLGSIQFRVVSYVFIVAPPSKGIDIVSIIIFLSESLIKVWEGPSVVI